MKPPQSVLCATCSPNWALLMPPVVLALRQKCHLRPLLCDKNATCGPSIVTEMPSVQSATCGKWNLLPLFHQNINDTKGASGIIIMLLGPKPPKNLIFEHNVYFNGLELEVISLYYGPQEIVFSPLNQKNLMLVSILYSWLVFFSFHFKSGMRFKRSFNLTAQRW